MCFLSTAEAHGLPCEFSGQVYQHGEDFQPSCQHQCTCMDGVVGCMPLCPQQMPLPVWRCSRPRLARPEGSCCEEWVCDDDNRISEEPDELTHASKQDSGPLSNHIGALLQAPLQPRTPAATRRVTFRGKTYPNSAHADAFCGLQKVFMLKCTKLIEFHSSNSTNPLNSRERFCFRSHKTIPCIWL